MRNVLIILFILSFANSKAQYFGGIGDGYASAELNQSTNLEQISASNIKLSSFDQELYIINIDSHDFTVLISSVEGKVIGKRYLKNKSELTIKLNPGFYLIIIQGNNSILTRKILI